MRAVVITAPGGPEVLEEREVARPTPAPSQVLVRIHATALNRADLLQRRGHYPAPPGAAADIPGLEYAGEVVEVGSGVRELAEGDRVMGLLGGGGYAEYAVVQERMAVPIPDALSFEEAAAVPEVFITAHDALFTRLKLGPGERLLIHAVGSGVGTAALQLARVAGATVLGTSRTSWKLERAVELGLDLAIDTGAGGFEEPVSEATAGEGVHAILDLVGGTYLEENLRSLASLGRQVVVGTVSGTRAEIDLGVLLRSRVTLVGTVLRSRPAEEKIAATMAFRRHALPFLADGRIEPVIDRVMPMSDVREAHAHMEENASFGKIVLSWE